MYVTGGLNVRESVNSLNTDGPLKCLAQLPNYSTSKGIYHSRQIYNFFL